MTIKSIQVLGSDCPTCKQLLETTKKVVKNLNFDIEVEYITDVSKIIEIGVMASPVLVINGKPVLTGGGKSESDIKQALQNSSNAKNNTSNGCPAEVNVN